MSDIQGEGSPVADKDVEMADTAVKSQDAEAAEDAQDPTDTPEQESGDVEEEPPRAKTFLE